MNRKLLSIIAAAGLTLGSGSYAMDISALTFVLGRHLEEAFMTTQEKEQEIDKLYKNYLPLACESKRLKQIIEHENGAVDVVILCSTKEKLLPGIRVALSLPSYDDQQAAHNTDSNLKTMLFAPFAKPELFSTCDNYLQLVELQKSELLSFYTEKVEEKLRNNEDPLTLMMVPTRS